MKQILCSLWLALSMALTSSALASEYNDGSRYAFMVSKAKQTVEVLDLAQGEKAGSIKFDNDLGMVAASERMKVLIAAHPESNALTLVDLNSNELKHYPYPLTLRPDYISLSPLDYNLVIYDAGQDILEVQSIHRRQTLARIEGIQHGNLATFSYDGSLVYVVEQQRGQLVVIDLIRGEIVRSLQLADNGDNLSALTRSADGSYGFISNTDKNQVYVLDLDKLQKITVLKAGKKPLRPWGTADGKIIVPSYSEGRITRFSATTFKKIDELTAVDNPVEVLTGWLDKKAAVIGESGEVVILDLENAKIVSRNQLNGKPDGTVVTADSRSLAVAVKDSGRVSLFDMKTSELQTTITGLPTDASGIKLAISNNVCH